MSPVGKVAGMKITGVTQHHLTHDLDGETVAPPDGPGLGVELADGLLA